MHKDCKCVGILIILMLVLLVPSTSLARARGNVVLKSCMFDEYTYFGALVSSCWLYAPSADIEVSGWRLHDDTWTRVINAEGDTVTTIPRGVAMDLVDLFDMKFSLLCYRTFNTAWNDSTALFIYWKE